METTAYPADLSGALEPLFRDLPLFFHGVRGQVPFALLPAEEQACLSPRAVAKRQAQFAAGRLCARQALEKAGCSVAAVLVGEKGSPVWPVGLVGSITHCGDVAASAVAHRDAFLGVGLDAEQANGSLAEGVAEHVCRPEDFVFMEGCRELEPDTLVRLFFSSRESVYKCLFPSVRQVFGFHEVEISLDIPGRCFAARPQSGRFPQFLQEQWLQGRFLLQEGMILTFTWWQAVDDCRTRDQITHQA